ncbi:MAG: carboxylesterase family protein, partial [Vallitaleaceae bacterium]|nr:carboxylesterase family protein [Vallitaleaceae bacterium]
MIVNTKYGQIEGITIDGCEVFKGVPYAKPPIGPLRFQKPMKPEAWEGIYQAHHFQARSMQGPDRGGFYHKEFYSNPDFSVPMSEDCLYLNLWIPNKKLHSEANSKLPVAIYVHGGAFLGGAGSNLPFVCNKLAEAGVIVITLNYRLGGFGFLCHPLLGVEGENEAGGNYGLWDQIAAISWVKENIEAFGGDSSNITVFGQSAGAMSLQTLALTESAEGLFQRMILQSGGGYKNPLAEYRSIERASDIAEDLLEELGIHHKEWKLSDEKRQQAKALLYETSSEEMMQAMG